MTDPKADKELEEMLEQIIGIGYGKQMTIEGQSDLWYARVGLENRKNRAKAAILEWHHKEIMRLILDKQEKVGKDGLTKSERAILTHLLPSFQTLLHQRETTAKIQELLKVGLSGGLSPETQAYLEERIEQLKSQLGDGE